MNSRSLRIATRRSPLALWQAEHVKARLCAAHPGLGVELLPMSTAGDRLLGQSLATAGGKGLFVKELEVAMLEGRADLAVHSMKDVPVQLPHAMTLAALLAGEDPRDAFVSNAHASLDHLPRGAIVGTASLRRASQLRALRPDLAVEALRGNVNTRLAKLDNGEYDAIILACAGLDRLGFSERIRERLAVTRMLPAIAQGVVGVECRADDRQLHDWLAALHDERSALRLRAERAFNARLGGACQVPVAGHATASGERLRLVGLVGSPDGSQIVRGEIEGPADEAAQLGLSLAERLLDDGATPILRSLDIEV